MVDRQCRSVAALRFQTRVRARVAGAARYPEQQLYSARARGYSALFVIDVAYQLYWNKQVRYLVIWVTICIYLIHSLFSRIF